MRGVASIVVRLLVARVLGYFDFFLRFGAFLDAPTRMKNLVKLKTVKTKARVREARVRHNYLHSGGSETMPMI